MSSTMTIVKPHANGHNGHTSGHETGPLRFADRFELKAESEAGGRLVAIAEELAAKFAVRAGEHDRDATYPFEAIEDLKERGYFSAPIPEEFGGLGVESVRDILVASSRLARGEPSVTIGLNMHLAAILNIRRRYRLAVESGNEARASAYGRALQMVSASGAVMAAAVSEPNQDLTRPATRAVRSETGWVINGKKIFCTMSPAASAVYVAVTFENDAGQERYGYALVPKDTPGITVHNDWDALGMRASGSHSVSFEDVHVPESALRGGFPAGNVEGLLHRNLEAGLFHASASLGIAEAANAQVLEALGSKRGDGAGERARNTILAAENAIDISAMRAIFDRAGRLIDQYYTEHSIAEGTGEEISAVFAEAQTAKAFINEASVRVVDRALTLSGGAGYFSRNPLSRAYRDVRAGAFMHPLGANRAYEFIGQMALGLPLDVS